MELQMDLQQEDLSAKFAIESSGYIHEVITGEVSGKEFDIDGKLFIKATISDCTIHIHSGKFPHLGGLYV